MVVRDEVEVIGTGIQVGFLLPDAPGDGVDDMLPLRVRHVLSDGIARKHFLFDFVVATGEPLEEGGRVLYLLEQLLDGEKLTSSIWLR